MEKAKKILFTVSGVLSIISIVVFLILAIVFIAFGNNVEAMEELANDSTNGTDAEAFKALFLALGVMFIFFMIFGIVNTILCFKGRNSDSKNVMILNIVFGVLSGIEINILAAIFGLIARNRKPQAQIE